MNSFGLSYVRLMYWQTGMWVEPMFRWKIVMTLNIFKVFAETKKNPKTDKETREKNPPKWLKSKVFSIGYNFTPCEDEPKTISSIKKNGHITKIDYTFWSMFGSMATMRWPIVSSLLAAGLSLLWRWCLVSLLWSSLANGRFVSIISFQLTHCSYCYTIVCVETVELY